jgi:16S rRNA (guanine527-N7)-methyltransferase
LSLTEFSDRLTLAWPELSSAQQKKVAEFYQLVVAENEIQNLTRLISPQDFVAGHVLDVKELLASGLLQYPAMDLGSGGGVPGLLAAAILEETELAKPWVLVDSEGRKAEFLRKSVELLGLSQVQVFGKRAEDVLKTISVDSIVARAVGPVERIFAWIQNCSTWNTLVLLKGPGWDEEWKSFQQSAHRKKLEIAGDHFYEVGAEKKRRRIVKLRRVKR